MLALHGNGKVLGGPELPFELSYATLVRDLN
jgi:hypothetical protein